MRSLGDIPRDAWNSLLRPDDNPFVTWDFLEALESSGSVGASRGWNEEAVDGNCNWFQKEIRVMQ